MKPMLTDEHDRQVEQCHLVGADNLDDVDDASELSWGADPFCIVSQLEEESGVSLNSH